MARTLAIHWSQTTHGTWLHGDPRGSWRDGRLIGPDPFLEAESQACLVDDAVRLNEVERRIVADIFGEIVRERRHRVLAATVQATHLHIVFAPLKEDVKRVIARLKYRSASAVLNHRRSLAGRPAHRAGLYSRAVPARRVPRSIWTIGQFPVFIFNDTHLANAIEYVRDHNRRHDLPPDPYPWINPLYAAGEFTGERMARSAVTEVLPW